MALLHPWHLFNNNESEESETNVDKNIKTGSKFKIEKAVAIPIGGFDTKTRYPFGLMEVGDSFVMDATAAEHRNAQAASSVYGRYHGKRFKTKMMSDGLRVWRIE